MLIASCYVCRFPLRFRYHVMNVSLSNNMTGVTNGTRAVDNSGASEYISGFNGVGIVQSLVFYPVFCRSMFVLLSFFCRSWHCLFFFVLRLLITHLVLNILSFSCNINLSNIIIIIYVPWNKKKTNMKFSTNEEKNLRP